MAIQLDTQLIYIMICSVFLCASDSLFFLFSMENQRRRPNDGARRISQMMPLIDENVPLIETIDLDITWWTNHRAGIRRN